MKHILKYPSLVKLTTEVKRREIKRIIAQCKKDHQTDSDLQHVHSHIGIDLQ